MYEFFSIFSLSDTLDKELKYYSKSLFPLVQEDYELSFTDKKLKVIGFSRKPINEIYFKNNHIYCFLIGECYSAQENRKTRRSVFCNCNDVYDFVFEDERKSLSKLKGNFIFISFNEKENICKIYSSRLSILACYFAIVNKKLYISTNLSEIIRNNEKPYEIDYVTLIEQQLFIFPFFNRTLIKNINRVPAGYILTVAKNGVKYDHYFDYRLLYISKKFSEKESLEKFSEKFYHICNDLISDQENFNSALTAGFDSRTINSIVLKSGKNIQNYAFGIPESSNITIPKNISKKLGLNFFPIYLDKEYEKEFDYWFKLSVLLSDGYLGERANYPYSYSKLRSFSGISINGNWGSETIRPAQNFGQLVSNIFYNILYSKNKIERFSEIYDSYINQSYLKKEILNNVKNEIINDLEIWFDFVKNFSLSQQIHMYLFFENERKFFANEIQTERLFCTNRYPYYDDDIIDLIFKSPFSGVNKTAFKKDFYSIFRSQYVYYKILEKYKPELLDFTTDHGYKPSALKNYFGFLNIAVGYTKRKFLKKFTQNITAQIAHNRRYSDSYYYEKLKKYLKNNEISNNLLNIFYYDLDLKRYRCEPRILDNLAATIIWLKSIN